MSHEVSPNPTSVKPKRRRWRWFLLGALMLLVVVGIPVGIWQYLRWSADAELQAVIAELDRTDPGWRLEDILKSRKPLPDEENGALVVIGAHKLMPANWEADLVTSLDYDFTDLPPAVQLNQKQIDELQDELGKAKKALAAARKLTKYKTGHYPIRCTSDWISTRLPFSRTAREVAKLLQSDAYFLAQEEKMKEAWNSCVASYRVSVSIANTDMLIAHLLRVGICMIATQNMERVLAQGELSDAVLANAQNLIEKDIGAPILFNAIRGERAGMHRAFLALQEGKLTLRQFAGKRGASTILEKLADVGSQVQIPKAHAYLLKYCNEAIKEAKKSPREVQKAFAKLDKQLENDKKNKKVVPAAAWVLPAVSKIAESDVRVRTQKRCAMVGLACERFRLARKRFPKDLIELVDEGLIGRVPIDPYDGKPLRFRHGKNGVIVYSIGRRPHEKYDGKALDNPDSDDPFAGSRTQFRLYHPHKRRQPPRPPKLKENQLVQTDVWTAGKDGYHTYRIPALLVTKKKTLLAFCEGRKDNSRDHGDIDLLVKRSSDYGWTWSEHKIVYEEGGDKKITIGNPCPVVDQKTGVIWMPFTRDNEDVFITHSKDDGQTWAKPVKITDSVKKKSWGWYATGPGVGIQMRKGKYKGRLVIPCDHREGKGKGPKHPTSSHIFFSDDHGKTWKLGGTVAKHTNECQVAELDDGKLLINMRNYWGRDGGDKTKGNMRAVATSDDGGLTWKNLHFDKTLIEPVCQASLIALPKAPAGLPQSAFRRLLFSNPASKTNRVNLTLRVSHDCGKTWSPGRLLNKGPSAYSCLAVLPDRTIGCLYETGKKLYGKIRFARFDWGWMEGDGLFPPIE